MRSAGIALTLLCAAAAAQERKDFVLENGIVFTVIRAPAAPTQATFSFLPLGLARDDAGRAQFSHLVEHMLIRTTDPAGLVAGGIRLNGETTGAWLRLETIAPAVQWKRALTRHGRWLAARRFDTAILEREKAAIAAEERNTVRRLALHKWALAAWNQVVRHRRPHAAVHGDVAGASIEALTAYVRRHVGLPERIVTIGPVQPGLLQEAATEAFASLARAEPPARTDVPEAADRRATWDLPARVYAVWAPLPVEASDERVFGNVLAELLQMALWRDAELQRRGARVTASADLLAPEGRWLFVSVALPDKTSVESARRRVDAILEALPEDPTLRVARPTLAPRLPDSTRLRAGLGAERSFLQLAQSALQLTYAELAVGRRPPAFGQAYATLSEESVRAFARRVLRKDRRGSLLLLPR